MKFEITNYDKRFKHCNTQIFPNEIPILNNETTYTDFFDRFMCTNVPCVIENITNIWEASLKWLNQDLKPDIHYLTNTYGLCEVTVYNCNKRYFNSQETETCSLNTFFKSYWNSDLGNGKYLKDWHLKNARKDDNFYKVPIYFASDWLNEFLVANLQDDYRFVYIGKKGTWTPLHSDVFGSYSWSANICGKKKWIFLLPGEENRLKEILNNVPYDISDVYKQVKHFELIQNSGEAIFVPSGWYHQVWNLEDTISINHNWINACNIMKIWAELAENLDKVKKEISDCIDMENFVQHCQVVLKASYGMNFFDFFELLSYIAEKRLQFLTNTSEMCVLFHGHELGRNHAKFDLTAVDDVLQVFKQHDDIAELLGNELQQFCNKIIDKM